MSNAIGFLELLGKNPQASMMSSEQLEELMQTMQLKDVERQALRDSDVGNLNSLMEARQMMVCQIWAPADEPGRSDEDSPEQETPGDEDEEEN